jgi:hypothetical protein
MNANANLYQRDDNSWMMEIQHESKVIEPVELGMLTKEQAQKEALRRITGPDGEIHGIVTCFDRHTMRAIKQGRVIGIAKP